MSQTAKGPKGTVAIIGSGPAGIFAAYALKNDGYSVTLFEKSNHLTLDGHSYRANNAVVDIPMRTFSGKYYANLFQVLDHLHIPTDIHRFHYVFKEGARQYFQFFSNFHRVLDCLRNDAFSNICLFICYLWYTIAVFIFPPRIVEPGSKQTETETLEQYTHRIWLPDMFLDWYLLPLFSSVATCSHDHLRQFPAAYIVNYRKNTLGAHHRTVSDMHGLQERLTEKVFRELQREVISVTSEEGKVIVQHRAAWGTSGDQTPVTATFDHSILATSAAEASRIHKASSGLTSQLSTCPVRVTVFQPSKEQRALQQSTMPSEILMLSTRVDPTVGVITHSTHLHPYAGVAVTVSAYSNEETSPETPENPLHVVKLIRPLPSPQSHHLLLDAFGPKSGANPSTWRNGDGNVYLAGGYASAGLPLLEACVRSGLEAAEAIGARLPFEIVRATPF